MQTLSLLILHSFSVKETATGPPLSMGLRDFELMERELNLHPSTPQYVQRAMKASRFWGPDGSTLSNTASFFKFFFYSNLRLETGTHQLSCLSRFGSLVSSHSTHKV